MAKNEHVDPALAELVPPVRRDRSARFLGFSFLLCFAAGLFLVFGGEDRAAVVAGEGPERPGIAVLDIGGVIDYSGEQGFLGNQRGAMATVESIRRLSENRLVRGLVLRVNSPGGSIGATQEIYNALRRFREAGKPVVVSMGDVAASGGYYIACAANRIFANPGTMTGSIGVIMSAPDLTGLYEWAKIEWNVIKSGRFKDIMSPSRHMTDDERAMLLAMVQDAYGQFFDAVRTSREIAKEKLENLAQGQIFSGHQAKTEGLVDVLGDFEAALLAAGKLAQIKGRPYVIRERHQGNLMELLGMMGQALAAPRISLLPGLDRGALAGALQGMPRVAYLLPGILR